MKGLNIIPQDAEKVKDDVLDLKMFKHFRSDDDWEFDKSRYCNINSSESLDN